MHQVVYVQNCTILHYVTFHVEQVKEMWAITESSAEHVLNAIILKGGFIMTAIKFFKDIS